MDQTRLRFTAVIPAAGSSSRMSGADKLMLDLEGMPVIARSIAAFEAFHGCEAVILVTSKDNIPRFRNLVDRYGYSKVRKIVEGGSNRQESVYNGLIEVETEFVAVHDGARPLVSQALLERLYGALLKSDGCIPVLPVKDTVKRVDTGGYVLETPCREELVLVQTPQCFAVHRLLEAYSRLKTGMTVTDDASIMEHAGGRVLTVPDDPQNIKITTPEDIAVARMFLRCGGDWSKA